MKLVVVAVPTVATASPRADPHPPRVSGPFPRRTKSTNYRRTRYRHIRCGKMLLQHCGGGLLCRKNVANDSLGTSGEYNCHGVRASGEYRGVTDLASDPKKGVSVRFDNLYGT